ncbi:MAG TPA: GrpB family protein [Candidatus Acidoferrales bacterium]|jgi:GrpB-like predicted nucleotidyltransferase (UPF0157 family)|nr:GrpB family protein [Candidatus Acidoferrales bacterium]
MRQPTLLQVADGEPVLIVDYDPSWPTIFCAFRDQLAEALGPLAIAIEHVGSTAVPGLPAKPIVDLDVVVRAADVAATISALQSLGYQRVGDLGIEAREAFRCPPEVPRHHLYVCLEGGTAFLNHLAFRDCLRADAEISREYAKLKMDLALRYRTDRAAYTEAKSAFIASVLERLA